MGGGKNPYYDNGEEENEKERTEFEKKMEEKKIRDEYEDACAQIGAIILMKFIMIFVVGVILYFLEDFGDAQPVGFSAMSQMAGDSAQAAAGHHSIEMGSAAAGAVHGHI